MPNGISNQSLYVMFPTIKTARLQKLGRKNKKKAQKNITNQADLPSQHKTHLNTMLQP